MNSENINPKSIDIYMKCPKIKNLINLICDKYKINDDNIKGCLSCIQKNINKMYDKHCKINTNTK
jgi:hypothetical protein